MATLSFVIAAVWVVPTASGRSVEAPAGRFDAEFLRAPRDPAAPTTAPASLEAYRLDWTRVALSLAAVLALIAVLRLAAKRWVVNTTSGTGRAVRMLGRTLIAPRQQIVILQVGRRVIIAADCAGQLTTLACLTEPDEVASLLGQLDGQALEPATAGFTKWFGRAREQFEESADVSPAALATGPAAASVPLTEDPSVERARGELAGLAERVRGLARQFRK